MEVGLWAAALNVMVRTFADATAPQWCNSNRAGNAREAQTHTRVGEKEARFAEANRAFGSYEINCS